MKIIYRFIKNYTYYEMFIESNSHKTLLKLISSICVRSRKSSPSW